MKNQLKTATLFVAMFCVSTVFAQTRDSTLLVHTRDSTALDQTRDSTVQVGGRAMSPEKNIVQNAVNSKVHTTLVAALRAAGLVETLQSEGPFTVFAPVNDAFENLPEGTVNDLLKPENKEMLSNILTYHVVSGKYDFDGLVKLIEERNGALETVNGGTLRFKMNGPHNISVVDQSGNVANISVYDIYQSNGVIHSIDSVLLPK